MQVLSFRLAGLVAAVSLVSGCWPDDTMPPAVAEFGAPDAGQVSDAAELPDVPDVTDTLADVASLRDIGPDTDAGSPAAWFACKQASDCTAVEVGCCDHCNGGKLTPAAKTFAASVKFVFGAKSCAGTQCTLLACSYPTLVCDQGQCALPTATTGK